MKTIRDTARAIKIVGMAFKLILNLACVDATANVIIVKVKTQEVNVVEGG